MNEQNSAVFGFGKDIGWGQREEGGGGGGAKPDICVWFCHTI
jgi:hypothetical protein